MKQCHVCKSKKPLSAFYKTKGTTSGYFNQCKMCVKKQQKKYRQENIEMIREKDRLRGLLSHRRKHSKKMHQKRSKDKNIMRRLRATREEYRIKNRQKVACHTLVNNAIQSGKLLKKPCEKCGSCRRVHAHHEDYNYPMDVVWLCPIHHGERHREINESTRRK